MKKLGYRILIVDDEIGILQLLQDYFEIQGYEVLTAQKGKEAIAKAIEDLDLILLDINLPDIDGLHVCQEIRGKIECPILFLTAKIEEQDRINGFLMGGDDYILKPFSIEELGARVMAHIRREKRRQPIKDTQKGFVISYSQRSIFYDGTPITFTKTEFNILELLSMNPGQIFSKEQIYEQVRGIDGTGDNTIITEHIRRIRNKISAYTDREYIKTVWGVGYQWIG